MALQSEMEARLRAALAPTKLEVRNDSAHHAGHAGDDGTGESHWHVTIAALTLDPLSRIARHRAVHDALGPDIMGRIHALAMKIEVGD